MRYTWSAVADVLMISRITLWRRLSDMNIPPSSYTDISNSDLDAVMSILVSIFPQNGIVFMWGHLKSINTFVTWQKVAESLMRDSPSTIKLNVSSCLPCPSSKLLVARGWSSLSNLMENRNTWSHRRLSRRILYLHASNNNRAETIFVRFIEAMECEWQSRVRS